MHLTMNKTKIQSAIIFLLAFNFSVSASGFAKASLKGPLTSSSFSHFVANVGISAAFLEGTKMQLFPIINQDTDSFYNYSAAKKSNAALLFSSFIGGEWTLNSKWGFQEGLGFNQLKNISINGLLVQGADIQSSDEYLYHYSISSRQLLLESKLFYILNQYLHPYMELGLGGSFNKAYDYSTTVPPLLTFTRQYSQHTQNSFSYLLGTGIDITLAKHFRMGLGYRFADLGTVKLGPATIDNSAVSGTLYQNHLHTNQILAQLTWII